VKNIGNLDGIKKPKKADVRLKSQPVKVRVLKVDGLVKRPVKKAVEKSVFCPFFVVPGRKKSKKSEAALFFQKVYSQQKVPVAAAVLALMIAFVSGMWSVLDTKSIVADDQPQVLGVTTDQPNSAGPVPSGSPVSGTQLQNQNSGSVDNNVLFNTPIEYLQSYFAAIAQPDIVAKRTTKLQAYLAAKNSPLVSAAGTIAQASHWKLILAIAFAESTLGKNCSDNNCSNIGVKPGAPSWRTYSSYSAWVADFNRLLDKKYSDWTLEQMCGVYVKPCNSNWLLATQEILNDLKAQGIE
jgi:hypothetical protein